MANIGFIIVCAFFMAVPCVVLIDAIPNYHHPVTTARSIELDLAERTAPMEDMALLAMTCICKQCSVHFDPEPDVCQCGCEDDSAGQVRIPTEPTQLPLDDSLEIVELPDEIVDQKTVAEFLRLRT